MPVNSKSPAYTRMSAKWERCRDAMCGEDAVHAKGEAYLPKLTEQEPEDYKAYLKRAGWYNATWRTIAGLKGMLLRKPPQVDVPETVKPLLDDVTMSGQPLTVFLGEISEEALGLGRLGVLVDYPVVDVVNMTMQQAKQLNMRPSMQMYKAEAIINWRVEYLNNQAQLTLVVLCERTEIVIDKYSCKYEDVYRVLEIADGRYQVSVWRMEGEKEILVEGPYFPIMNGKPLDFIPFQFIGSDDTTPDVDEPPLIDLVDVNYSHYRTNADYEHAAHFVGLPTPVVSGYTPQKEGEKLYLGATKAWVFPDSEAKATFLEFTGQGLDGLAKVLDRKEQHMAVLGARMLEQMGTRKAVESSDSQSIKRKGEESMLAETSQVISLGMSQVLVWFCAWAGTPDEEAEVEMTRDFYPVPMTFQMLTALVGAWQAGAISDQVLFENLKEGEIIDEDMELEEMQAQIASQPPRTADDLALLLGGVVPPKPGMPKPKGGVQPGKTGPGGDGGTAS